MACGALAHGFHFRRDAIPHRKIVFQRQVNESTDSRDPNNDGRGADASLFLRRETRRVVLAPSVIQN
jgi:hypothetical protein